MASIAPQKLSLIEFLIDSAALKFGEFTLKSGRIAPYFINSGSFNDGEKIFRLGKYYAEHIVGAGLADVDVIFGPSYKGIPLCVTTTMSLFAEHGRSIGFAFNRKEAKTRGEGGIFVGAQFDRNSRIVIVEDVVSAGTTLREVIPLVRELSSATIQGVVVLVDRCEKGTGELSAIDEAHETLGVNISPIISIYDILMYLGGGHRLSNVAGKDGIPAIEKYLATYGSRR